MSNNRDPAQAIAAAERLEHLAKLMRERGVDVVAVAREIRERMDDRWMIDPSSTGRRALTEVATHLGIDEGDLTDLVKLIWFLKMDR